MKRFLVLSFLAAAAALGIWYGLRGGGARTTSSATVTALLPKDTLALLFMPDFEQTRAQWHETDLYKLWREPAVQEFLQRPLSRLPQGESARAKWQEVQALKMRDAFLAVTAMEGDRPVVLGGFRFQGSAGEAEKLIAPWRAQLHEQWPELKREVVTYEKHEVEILNREATTVATAYDGDWFFASNDVPTLKAVLDRVDQRVTETVNTLLREANFVAAGKHLPPSYAVLGYARVDDLMQKMAANLPAEDAPGAAMRQIKSIAVATNIEGGKFRDVLFVGVPPGEAAGDLTRASLALTTKETFLYCASLFHLPGKLDLPNSPAAAGGWLPPALRRFTTAAAASGIKPEDWKTVFGDEVGVIGDWPAGTRVPSLFAAVAVKDEAKARQMIEALTAAAPEADDWTASEKDGAHYYAQRASNPMVPVAPTIGLSSHLLVAGLDRATVERALSRKTDGKSEFAETAAFQAAQSWIAGPHQSFTYVDTALFYQRLDAAVRPMLIMAAAFVPGIADTVDLGKLPAAEVITSHLSPLVIARRYRNDGYEVEAVGPFSVYPAILGGIVATGAGSNFYRPKTPTPSNGEANPPAIAPDPSPSPEETSADAPAASEADESPSPTASP